MNYLLQPKEFVSLLKDEGSKEIMKKTIDFFEKMGKTKLTEDFNNRIWYKEFLEFIKEEKIFYKLLTPSKYSDGDTDCRWDTARNCEFSELLAFYGIGYWYCFQVSILGLGPIWMSDNEVAKNKAAKLLKEGGIFAFGLSEREHGADIYSTETMLKKVEDGKYIANGEKYYIGNGNEAEMISTFGKMDDESKEYVFFVTNFKHKQYELIKNVVSHQEYVANFVLKDYPIEENDILIKGQDAWNSALNTVNIGKFNIGPASIGVCEHCFYEAINHASKRKLYGMYVTDMPHVKKGFVDAWLRLMAMKLYQRRATDYFRNANKSDRRYLLFNPTSKMKVTLQAEVVISLLWNIIAAKGFESDTYFSIGAQDIMGPSKLEGTVHVNVQLIRKFIESFFFYPEKFEPVLPDFKIKDDNYLFNQGPAKGLSKVKFHDYTVVFEKFKDLSNVKNFISQTNIFKKMLIKATPSKEQSMNSSFALPIGEMFSIVVYGSLILEQALIMKMDLDVVNQVFDFMVRDFAAFGLDIYENHLTNEDQLEYFKEIMLIKPEKELIQYENIWKNYVFILNDKYEMNL